MYKQNREKFSGAIEIQQNRLYWISDYQPPKCKNSQAFYFCIDDNLVYEPFVEDFGPLNLAMTHKYCMEVNKIMTNPDYKKHKIYHYTSTDYRKRANAAFLMGAYLIVIMKKSAEEAWSFFANVEPKFKPFRDATCGDCTYECTVLHCLKGLEYGIQLGWYDPSNFNVKEYEEFERVDNGDMNWIIPGKLLAFSSPSNSQYDSEGYRTYTPDDYAPLFKKWNINLVVRLNKATYDKDRFLKNGIKHKELYFIDGSTPSEQIIENFLDAVEKEKGAVAIHCKAGLGRTGSLISIYAMKHHRFPAEAFIGYIRIARPGSILGPQQQFLCEKEKYYLEKGEMMRKQKNLTDQLCVKIENLSLSKKVKYSKNDEKISRMGESGQAEYLLKYKRNNKG